jgi:hypothetical protein
MYELIDLLSGKTRTHGDHIVRQVRRLGLDEINIRHLIIRLEL